MVAEKEEDYWMQLGCLLLSLLLSLLMLMLMLLLLPFLMIFSKREETKEVQ